MGINEEGKVFLFVPSVAYGDEASKLRSMIPEWTGTMCEVRIVRCHQIDCHQSYYGFVDTFEILLVTQWLPNPLLHPTVSILHRPWTKMMPFLIQR